MSPRLQNMNNISLIILTISIEVNLTASIQVSVYNYCILHCLGPSAVALVPDWTNTFCPVTCGVAFPRELPVCGLPGPFTNEAEFVNWVFQIKKLGMRRDDTNGRLPIEQPFILAMSCFCAKVAAKAIADASLAWTKSMSVVFRVFRILVIPPTRFDCLKPGCQAGLPKD